MDRIKHIMKYGKSSLGKRDLIRYLKGERLTLKQAVRAKCFDCCGFYADGKLDCTIAECPLYLFMPYRKDKQEVKRERTEKQREATQKLAGFHSVTRSSSMQESTKGMSLDENLSLQRKKSPRTG